MRARRASAEALGFRGLRSGLTFLCSGLLEDDLVGIPGGEVLEHLGASEEELHVEGVNLGGKHRDTTPGEQVRAVDPREALTDIELAGLRTREGVNARDRSPVAVHRDDTVAAHVDKGVDALGGAVVRAVQRVRPVSVTTSVRTTRPVKWVSFEETVEPLSS
jgi:hypothetical protein